MTGRMVLAMAAAMAALPLQAASANNVETLHAAVSYADLDLATAAGIRQLRTRVSVAVDRVCGPADRASLRMMVARTECMKAARGDARSAEAAAIAAAQADRAHMLAAR